ncbi:putative major facilitator superfamily transporter [Sphingomonas changbaiensis NBRC 104936]|uniref:Putative major facilitator superfamily transporter n=2 Tax=Sphingomonas changbaiensis TaxID=529705 RepID=A0A0E9MRZ5_9SPHN|nr:putative major facilitator superfamily transporter [Sphingomonas changbaiensis NBRC 104936]
MHAPTPPRHDVGFREFVALIAALMAMTALQIDTMLPALPAIGHSLHVANPNDRQWVISAFMFGFGAAQIVHGPLSDRFGRRPVLLISLAFGVICNLTAAVAATFPLLLAARVAAGVATASSRVLATSIVRDRFVGNAMARVMSLVTIVFMVVPIAAPNLGQLILWIAPWRWIFYVLTAAGLLTFLWSAIRLPETLDPANRLPLSVRRIGEGFRFVLMDRLALGYTIGSTALQGGLFGFLLSVQQIFESEFHAVNLFAPVFSAMAATMAAAAFLNSRIVMRFGARAVSHRAVIGYTVFATLHLALALAGLETVLTFAVLQALMMSCFGLAGANFGAIAMEHMGRLAGTASSVQGLIQTIGGISIGAAIGAAFNGSTVPLYTGFTLSGLAAIAAVAFAERGKLFGRS